MCRQKSDGPTTFLSWEIINQIQRLIPAQIGAEHLILRCRKSMQTCSWTSAIEGWQFIASKMRLKPHTDDEICPVRLIRLATHFSTLVAFQKMQTYTKACIQKRTSVT
jgi:hypothetical protein